MREDEQKIWCKRKAIAPSETSQATVSMSASSTRNETNRNVVLAWYFWCYVFLFICRCRRRNEKKYFHTMHNDTNGKISSHWSICADIPKYVCFIIFMEQEECNILSRRLFAIHSTFDACAFRSVSSLPILVCECMCVHFVRWWPGWFVPIRQRHIRSHVIFVTHYSWCEPSSI